MVMRPVHCRVQSSAKCHYRFQKCLWEENKGKTYGKCSICLVSTSAEAPWAWPVVCHVFCFSQKHKFGKKLSPLRRFMVMGKNKLLFKKWHLRHCRLPENLKHVKSPNLLEAPFCLLKSLISVSSDVPGTPILNPVSTLSPLPPVSRAHHIYF